MLSHAGVGFSPKLQQILDCQLRINKGLISVVDLEQLVVESNLEEFSTNHKPMTSMPKDSPSKVSAVQRFKDGSRKLEIDRRMAKVRGFRLIPSPEEDSAYANASDRHKSSPPSNINFRTPQDFDEPNTEEPGLDIHKQIQMAIKKVELVRDLQGNSHPLNLDKPKEVIAQQQQQISDLTHTVNNQKQLLDKISSQLEVKTDDPYLTGSAIQHFVQKAIEPLENLIRHKLARECLSCGGRHINTTCPYDPEGILAWQPKKNKSTSPHKFTYKSREPKRNHHFNEVFIEKSHENLSDPQKKYSAHPHPKLTGNPMDIEGKKEIHKLREPRTRHKGHRPTKSWADPRRLLFQIQVRAS